MKMMKVIRTSGLDELRRCLHDLAGTTVDLLAEGSAKGRTRQGKKRKKLNTHINSENLQAMWAVWQSKTGV
jgi:hypothetical protein